MSRGYDEDDEGIGCFISLIAVVLLGAGFLLGYNFLPEKIIVDTKIEPEIRIVVEDNVIDTLYIYKNY